MLQHRQGLSQGHARACKYNGILRGYDCHEQPPNAGDACAGWLHQCAAEPHWSKAGAPTAGRGGALPGSCVSSRPGGRAALGLSAQEAERWSVLCQHHDQPVHLSTSRNSKLRHQHSSWVLAYLGMYTETIAEVHMPWKAPEPAWALELDMRTSMC